jgi:hypothetical protein
VDQASNVIAFPIDRPPSRLGETHPLVKSITNAMTALGALAQQIEKWPMDADDKWRMLNTIRALALQTCELQLVAVAEVADQAKFREDLDRVTSALRLPES